MEPPIRPTRFVLFYHASHAKAAEGLAGAIQAISTAEIPLTVSLMDHHTITPQALLDNLDALVVLFTPLLETDETLFRVIQAISPQPGLERFFVFPEVGEDGKTPLPKIFHPLRAQQHHIYGNPVGCEDRVDLSAFQTELIQRIRQRLPMMMSNPSSQATREKQVLFDRVKKAWHNPKRTIILFSVILFLVLAVAAIMISPHFMATLRAWQTPLLIGFKVPDLGDKLLNEDFTRIRSTMWAESSRYKGINPLETAVVDGLLVINVTSPIDHAVYRLDSQRVLPLDDLAGFETRFNFGALQGESELYFMLTLVEDPAYYFGCKVAPNGSTGNLQCLIQEPVQKVLIAESPPLTLDEWHTLTVGFLPSTYVVRLFLDGNYIGQAALPSVAEWRGKDFSAGIWVEAQSLEPGDFASQIDYYLLARQDR